ncbi:hypothetical protein Q2941_26050 [Bradyrhizobium sp. UFLA05-153]
MTMQAVRPHSTRRQSFAQTASVAAASATILPAAAAPVALDGAKLQAADDALKAAEADYSRKDEAYFAWEKKNPQPANGNDRHGRGRWDGKFKRWERENGYLAAQLAQEEATDACREAQLAVAQYRPRDMNELVHKACLGSISTAGKGAGAGLA